MKFAKKISLAMLAIWLVALCSACGDDGPEVTEEEFIEACREGDTEVVKRGLKQNKGFANAKAEGGWTALMLVHNEDIEVAKLLLSKGADVNAKRDSGITALMNATREGDVDIVKLLLSKGADVNAKTNAGVTALMFATSRGDLDIVKLLLDKGADINAKNKDGRTAVDFAYYHEEIAALFKARGVVTEEEFLEACEYGDTELVKIVLKHNKNFANTANENGYTALMAAALSGEVEIVKLLIEKGAYVNAKNVIGLTALDCAEAEAQYEVAAILKRNGGKNGW